MNELPVPSYPDGSVVVIGGGGGEGGGGGGGAYLTAGLNGAGAHSERYRPPTPVAPASVPLRSVGVVVAYTLPRRGQQKRQMTVSKWPVIAPDTAFSSTWVRCLFIEYPRTVSRTGARGGGTQTGGVMEMRRVCVGHRGDP